MTDREILSNLCVYDDRNPDGMIHCMDKEDYEEAKLTRQNKCSCDNCFHGRTEMAEYILKLKGYTTPVGDLNEVKESNKKKE